jgi:hypothetical protein
VKFALATAQHDAALRRLLRDQPMPGWVRLAFACEPSWAEAHAVMGYQCQTLVGTDDSGAVLGCGVRSIRRHYVNGHTTELGYLSGLRSLPHARGALGLAQGFRFLRELHDADRRVPAYLTTIVEDNTAAAVLLGARAGLPRYRELGRFATTAVLFDRRRRTPEPNAGLSIRTGADVPADRILAFLRAEGARRQFFPVVARDAFSSGLWRGLQPADFRVLLRGEEIVAVAAAWDQSAFRQTMIAGYDPLLRVARPAANLLLRLRGLRPLPPVGERLRCFHLALVCVAGDEPEFLAALLDRFHADWRDSDCSCFLVGLHERDPLRPALRRFATLEYWSRLHLVHWDDGADFCAALEPTRIPHLETALL